MTALEDCTAERATDQFRYDRILRAFHWSTAILIVVAMAIGLYCAYLPPGQATRRFLLEWHKSLGMTALVLILPRMAYRLAIAAPPYAERMSRAAHVAAKSVHLTLYALALFMPLTGYWYSAAGGYSRPFFWLFQWPLVLPIDKASSHVGGRLHLWGAWAIYAVLGLHVVAVLWHRFVKRDGVLSRMLPGRQ